MAQGLQKGLSIIRNMYKIIITKIIGKRIPDGSMEYYGIPKSFWLSYLLIHFEVCPTECSFAHLVMLKSLPHAKAHELEREHQS